MRRGDQHFAAGGGGGAAHRDRFPNSVRAVVDPGQNVHVQIDHQPASLGAVGHGRPR